MQDSPGVKVITVDFSNPQGGKVLLTVCHDQRPAKIIFGLSKGNDVTTADQMKATLLSHGGVNGLRVTVVKGQKESSPLEKSKIPGVNKLNNFEPN